MAHADDKHRETLSRWVDNHSRYLLDYALGKVADKEEAMDLVQETFLSASRSHESFEGRSSPRTWLRSILQNKIADFYRKSFRSPENVSLSAFFDESGSWTDHSVLGGWPIPHEGDEDRDGLLDALSKCVSRLPLQFRTAVSLYYLEDRKTAAVCDELMVSQDYFWKILSRGRMRLRKCLEINWFEL